MVSSSQHNKEQRYCYALTIEAKALTFFTRDGFPTAYFDFIIVSYGCHSVTSAGTEKEKETSTVFMARLILHSIEELSELLKEIRLRHENSKEALNAERERKMRILKSLR
uniref:Uncharacterized protein LOC113787646 n=1 Tax=Cicer arietinum TaxID=3827 RepID=A0A3Q7XVI0_CICAR|nr:uncharacterized protein LOC113787646 [Cicer arietinum]